MNLLTWMRGSYGVFRGLLAFSRVGRLFRRTSVWERSRTLRREAAIPADYLNGQGLPPLAQLPYGKWRMERNGCEVVAACNALRFFGEPPVFSQVADALEDRGLLFQGYGGTNPAALPGFFRSKGIAVSVVRRRDAAKFDEAIPEGGCGILSYWTGKHLRRADGSFHTLHTVFLCRDGGLRVWNVYANDRRPREFPSVSEFLRRESAEPLCLLALSVKKGLTKP